MNRRHLLIGAPIALGLTSCVSDPRPHAVIDILVDLSGTWHNSASRGRNERTLREIGMGVAQAASELDPPVAVQHRVIGFGSLERPPLCQLVYQPSLVRRRTNNLDLIQNSTKLEHYLGEDCPRVLLSQAAEKSTEISAAVASAIAPKGMRSAKRFIIIASDFFEEANSPAPIGEGQLQGFKVLMAYRPLAQDEAKPAAMQVRIRAWKALFEERGAKEVSAQPDTGINRADISAFLLGAN